jgi:hypothetical protein
MYHAVMGLASILLLLGWQLYQCLACITAVPLLESGTSSTGRTFQK